MLKLELWVSITFHVLAGVGERAGVITHDLAMQYMRDLEL